MKNATIDNFELLVECCKAILSAESPEEVAMIKENLPVCLREHGWDEETITTFMKDVDGMVMMCQLEEIVVNEDGQFVKKEETNVQETVGADVPTSSINTNLNPKGHASVFGAAAGAIVLCMALKNKIFNKNKIEGKEPWEKEDSNIFKR